MMKNYIIAGLMAALMLPVCGQAREWHVSNKAAADGDGSAEKPFTTLEAVRDAIRSEKAKEVQTVWIHEGRYRLEKTFKLGKTDSGSASGPVIYRAIEGDDVSLTSGMAVPTDLFRPAKGQELNYLAPSARNKVIVAELKGLPVAKGFTTGQGKYGLLTWNEHSMQLAGWPNRGYVHIDKVVDMGPTVRWLTADEKPLKYSFEKPVGGKFTLSETTDFAAWSRELQRTKDVLQDGYLSCDWTKDANQLARVSDDGVIQLLDSTRYGIGGIRYSGGFAKEGQKPTFMHDRRLLFENLLCELDMPGEWYFDRNDKKLYIWPITEDYRSASVAVPGGPTMIELTDVDYVMFRDIIFEHGGQFGVKINGGSNNVFAGCTFRNFTGRAAVVSGKKNGFNGCDFYNLFNAVTMTGGDLRTLTRADNYITNCDFHHLRLRGYGGIGFDGCGIIFKNNIYHDSNAGIIYSGAYIEFTNNEFYNVGWEMGDWNVLYQGAKKWCNGNLVQNNFFHHFMEEPSRHPVLGARNDDGGTGTMYKSNIFYKTGRGAVAFGGPNSHIQDNLVLECELIWWTAALAVTPDQIKEKYDQIAEQFESGRYPRGGKGDTVYNVEKIVGKEGWNKSPWGTAFPNFQKYMNENPFAQSYGSMLNNYHDRVSPENPYKVVHMHGSWGLNDKVKAKTMDALPESFDYNAPQPIDMATSFVDKRKLNFRFVPGFKMMPGFEPCDMDQVGLYKSKFRPNPPNQDEYRGALYDRFKFTASAGGSYDPDTAALRYPVQPWMPQDAFEVTAYPYISGMEGEREFAHGGIKRDGNYNGKTISLNGVTYDYGLMICPRKPEGRGMIEFDLSPYPQAKGFKAVVGIDDMVKSNGSAAFIVEGRKNGQWQQLYISRVLRGKDDGVAVHVSLEGCDAIRLITTDGSNGIGADHAVWADAQFTE